ncbi:hypothetical protein DPMN_177467 [Dreissena polymorpha]|uniref:Uncharacterized protein n=1 Tax=Dreissena polymorpha TaxID=45954 RepID=A0A9D4EBQ7_DREPO|nr:hypothetical protein DPMN_177467 [Dreissena polymorpha]
MATETPYWTFGMRGPSGRRSLPSFVAIRHLLLRDNRRLQAPIMGNSGPIRRRLAYLRRHFHRNDGTGDAILDFWHACPSGEEVCQVSSLSYLPTPRE